MKLFFEQKRAEKVAGTSQSRSLLHPRLPHSLPHPEARFNRPKPYSSVFSLPPVQENFGVRTSTFVLGQPFVSIRGSQLNPSTRFSSQTHQTHEKHTRNTRKNHENPNKHTKTHEKKFLRKKMPQNVHLNPTFDSNL